MPPESLPSISSPGISILSINLERTHFSQFLPTQPESFKGKCGRLLFAIANLMLAFDFISCLLLHSGKKALIISIQEPWMDAGPPRGTWYH